jgi:hypothetical protein
MGERIEQRTARATPAGGLTGGSAQGPTLTVDDAKEAAANAVELVKEKLGEAVRSDR